MRGVVDPRDIKRISIICAHVSQIQMDVSKNGGTQQPWVFLQKMIILGCFGGSLIFGNNQMGSDDFSWPFRWFHSQVKELLKGQVDLRSKAPRYGHSALHRAALHGHHAVVKALLLAKADVEERDDEGGDLVGWNDERRGLVSRFFDHILFWGDGCRYLFFLALKRECVNGRNILKQMGGVS